MESGTSDATKSFGHFSSQEDPSTISLHRHAEIVVREAVQNSARRSLEPHPILVLNALSRQDPGSIGLELRKRIDHTMGSRGLNTVTVNGSYHKIVAEVLDKAIPEWQTMFPIDTPSSAN